MPEGVDARISMGFQPTPNIGPDIGGALKNANALMQLNQARQEQQRLDALRGILGQAGAIGPLGVPTPDAMSQIYKIAPEIGMKLQQGTNALTLQQTQIQEHQQKRYQTIQDMVDPIRTAAIRLYNDTPGSTEAKQRAAQNYMAPELDKLRVGGGLTPEETQRLPRVFDIRTAAANSDAWQKQQEQLRREKRAEKHDESMAERSGASVVIDNEGNPVVFRPNAASGQPKATYLDGNPVPSEKLTGARKIGTGGAGDTPGRGAERDAMAIADSRIAAAEKERGSPLNPEEKAKIRQDARSDPKVQEASRKQETTAINDDAATLTAEETLRGDWHGTVGMGRNAASMRKIANERARIAKERNMTGADLAANTAEYNGIMAAERVLGTRGAGIDLGIAEAQKFAPMVLELSDRIDRTRFPTVNAMQLAIEKGAGGENVIRLTDALNAYKMAYTQILTRGGMPTDDSRRRSDEVIDKAWSNGQIHAAIDQLNQEMTAARSAVPEVRDNLYFALTGKKRSSEVLPTTKVNTTPPGRRGAAEPDKTWPAPPDAAIEKLRQRRANPNEITLFNHIFGPGAAERVLGGGGAPAPVSSPNATGSTDPLAMARDAIARGAPRDAVIKRLRDNGIDPGGL